ncbi:MAG: hypothetical protein ACRDVE_00890 [Actinocrinis sp.]
MATGSGGDGVTASEARHDRAASVPRRSAWWKIKAKPDPAQEILARIPVDPIVLPDGHTVTVRLEDTRFGISAAPGDNDPITLVVLLAAALARFVQFTIRRPRWRVRVQVRQPGEAKPSRQIKLRYRDRVRAAQAAAELAAGIRERGLAALPQGK